jgi:hypothetical protein
MAVTSKQVSVGTTAVSLFTADTDGNTVYITFENAGYIYLGGPGVTTSTGMRIEHAAGVNPVKIELGADEALWAIGAVGTEVITVLATNF